MGREERIAEKLSSLLPDRPVVPGQAAREELVEEEASRLKARQDAKELARIKYAEKKRLKRLEEKQAKDQALAQELGFSEPLKGKTRRQMEEIARQKELVEAVEAIEERAVQPLHPEELAKSFAGDGAKAYSSVVKKAVRLQGATRPEVLKLLASLNINLSVQLSKQDTANLLACLLTCNESQLHALLQNKKVPVVIKTVIKRLLDDMKLGNIETVEKLWDRVFGKNAMSLDLPEPQQLKTGIIPDVPVSREAYLIIRDTLIK